MTSSARSRIAGGIVKPIAKIIKQAPTEQVMSDLDATVAYAKAAGKADVARLAVTGR
jgi:carboxymethylenebutenolidase